MRTYLLLALLLLTGCGSAPNAPAGVAATAEQTTILMTATPIPSAQDSQQLSALHEQLRRARKKIEDQYHANPTLGPELLQAPFRMLAPTELVGYDVEPLEVFDLQDMGASVRVRLVDRSDPQRWLEFLQFAGCYGITPSPPQGTSTIEEPHRVNIPGVDTLMSLPELQSWKESDGSLTVLLLWYSNVRSSPNIIYELKGHTISAETVVRFAAVLRPVE